MAAAAAAQDCDASHARREMKLHRDSLLLLLLLVDETLEEPHRPTTGINIRSTPTPPPTDSDRLWNPRPRMRCFLLIRNPHWVCCSRKSRIEEKRVVGSNQTAFLSNGNGNEWLRSKKAKLGLSFLLFRWEVVVFLYSLIWKRAYHWWAGLISVSWNWINI